MYVERHSIKIQFDMHIFFSLKTGVNIQELTHLVCLLNSSRPSQGEYFELVSVTSIQSKMAT